MTYTPDLWVVVKLNGERPHYRVFGSWYGGYSGSDRWRMNSGITAVESDDGCYKFTGSTGSVYVCGRRSYGTSGYGGSVLNTLINDHPELDIEILDVSTDFMNLEYV